MRTGEGGMGYGERVNRDMYERKREKQIGMRKKFKRIKEGNKTGINIA